MSERVHILDRADAARIELGELIDNRFPSISYLAQFEPPSWVFEDADPDHDDRHAAGTVIAGNILMELPDFSNLPIDRDLVNYPLILHDCGRSQVVSNLDRDRDDREHSQNGVGIVRELLQDSMTASSLHIVEEMVKGHGPNGIFDESLPPILLRLIKVADKSQLIRVERENPGTVDWERIAQSLDPETIRIMRDILFPIFDSMYDRVDDIREMFRISGYKAMLLAGVEKGIVAQPTR